MSTPIIEEIKTVGIVYVSLYKSRAILSTYLDKIGLLSNKNQHHNDAYIHLVPLLQLSHLCRIVNTSNQRDDSSGGGVVKYAHDTAGIDAGLEFTTYFFTHLETISSFKGSYLKFMIEPDIINSIALSITYIGAINHS